MDFGKGMLLELSGGRKGIAYNKDQNNHLSKLLIYIVDKNYNLIYNPDGKPKIVFKKPNEVKLIGLVD